MARIPVIDVLFSPEALSCSSSTQLEVPCAEHPDSLVAAMDVCGVLKALLAPCKQWQCERHWICGEVQVDEISSYIQAAPERLAGLAGYNPYCIVESLNQIRSAIRLLDMRGVYVPTEAAALSVLDRRMYPLYARCTELGVPVVLEAGTEKRLAHATQLAEIAKDFPELEIVAAAKGALDVELALELMSRHPNLFFAFSTAKTDQVAVISLLNSNCGERLMWGSNGESWELLLEKVRSLEVRDNVLQSFLHGTAARVFNLSRPTFSSLRPEETLSIAD